MLMLLKDVIVLAPLCSLLSKELRENQQFPGQRYEPQYRPEICNANDIDHGVNASRNKKHRRAKIRRVADPACSVRGQNQDREWYEIFGQILLGPDGA